MSRPEDRLPEKWRDGDVWLDAYYDEEDDPDEDTLLALLEIEARDPKFTFFEKTFDAGRVIYVARHKNRTVALYDNEGGDTFRRVRRPEEWIVDIDPTDFYAGDAERLFNREFWLSPVPLYHGTTDLEGVMASELEARSESRGITNRHVGDAVFTSVDADKAEEYAHGRGGGVLKIDTRAMKRDGFRPFVAEEPDARDERLRGGVAHALQIDWQLESMDPGAADPDTVIVFASIPTKYLTPLK